MRTLDIVWQRLVSADGRTCDRCNTTHQEMLNAFAKLTSALTPLGIEPRLQVLEIEEAAYKAAPCESNRICIAGRPMEDWLGAEVGSSSFFSVCGDSECRTVALDDATFEAIPEALVIKAALIAASRMIVPTGSGAA